jgi:hypothetical protein
MQYFRLRIPLPIQKCMNDLQFSKSLQPNCLILACRRDVFSQYGGPWIIFNTVGPSCPQQLEVSFITSNTEKLVVGNVTCLKTPLPNSLLSSAPSSNFIIIKK